MSSPTSSPFRQSGTEYTSAQIRSAWLLHGFTTLGIVAAMLALRDVLTGHPDYAIVWLLLTLLIDGVDGPVARALEVEKRAERGLVTPADARVDLRDHPRELRMARRPFERGHVALASRIDVAGGERVVGRAHQRGQLERARGPKPEIGRRSGRVELDRKAALGLLERAKANLGCPRRTRADRRQQPATETPAHLTHAEHTSLTLAEPRHQRVRDPQRDAERWQFEADRARVVDHETSVTVSRRPQQIEGQRRRVADEAEAEAVGKGPGRRGSR